jgi:Zinc finger C-x8-C-x5-C-x3-H type (and similar)
MVLYLKSVIVSFTGTDAMWQMSLSGGEQVDAGSYPERPGEPDCSYYMRTGTCRFGMTCKFNHPPNRALVSF